MRDTYLFSPRFFCYDAVRASIPPFPSQNLSYPTTALGGVYTRGLDSSTRNHNEAIVESRECVGKNCMRLRPLGAIFGSVDPAAF